MGALTPLEQFLSEESETLALGAWLAERLDPGDTVLLRGPLGAGKTTLVRGLLRARGIEEPVRSPTFAIYHVYEGPPRLVHADLYRLEGLTGTGLEDFLGEAICLIEWPERAPELESDADAWVVELDFEGDGRRARVIPPASRLK